MIKTCDVLYIHSTRNPMGPDNMKYAIMPMGIIGILNNLKNRGLNVVGINYAIEKFINPQYDLQSTLKNIKYKILLTDLHWYEHSFGAIYIAEQSKKAHPATPVIVGGYTSTIFSCEIIENFCSVDYIVTGDSDLPTALLVDFLLERGEYSLEAIPNITYRQESAIITSKKTWVQNELDTIDFINTDMFENSEYIPYLTTGGLSKIASHYWLCIARGCKYNCTYCCGANSNMNTLFHRCNILTRSPSKIASDFHKLSLAGINRICPSHDFEMFGTNFYRTLFSEIRDLDVTPGMYLECFQLPTKEYIDDILKTFNKSHLVLVISPISGNEKLRKDNGKFFSNSELLDVLNYIKDKEIKLQLYYTLNLFEETEVQFLDTYLQIKYIHEVLGLNKKCIYYQHVVIDPLAGMRMLNNIQVEYNTFMDYYNYCAISEDGFKTSGFKDNGEIPLATKRKKFESI